MAIAWVAGAATRVVRRRARRTPGDRGPGPLGWHRVAATVGALTAALVVGNAALFLWAPGLVDSGFLG